jgi:hypothetical protein
MVNIEMLITLSSHWLLATATRQPEYSASSILLATQVYLLILRRRKTTSIFYKMKNRIKYACRVFFALCEKCVPAHPHPLLALVRLHVDQIKRRRRYICNHEDCYIMFLWISANGDVICSSNVINVCDRKIGLFLNMKRINACATQDNTIYYYQQFSCNTSLP